MREVILFISMLLAAQLSSAQITFQKTYGTPGYDGNGIIQQTSDGGYIIFGDSDSSGGNHSKEAYLLRLNAYGDILWTKIVGAPGEEFVFGGLQTSDGGYVITGSGENMSSGYHDVFLYKTDSTGSPIWAKTYGTAFEHGQGLSVQQAADGGYIITGRISLSGGTVFVIRTDGNGDSLWTKKYEGLNPWCKSVCLTSDGGFVISGEQYGLLYYGMFLVKINSFGDILWSRNYSSSPGNLSPIISNNVQQTMDGGFICTGGIKDSSVAPLDVFLIKTDSIGNISWSKRYGGPSDEWGYTVRQTVDGGYIIAGTHYLNTSNSEVYLIRTDINGDTLWTRTMGGSSFEYGGTVNITSDGGFIVSGGASSFNTGNTDIYIIKADSNGISGCHQAHIATMVTSPTLQSAGSLQVGGSPFDFVTSPALIANYGGTATTLCSSVSINEVASGHSLSVFPNPTSGNFSVTFSQIIPNGSLELHNILGQSIYYKTLTGDNYKQIEIHDIPEGIYFVKVSDGMNSYCSKLLVQHAIK
jgi:hypothetical protein